MKILFIRHGEALDDIENRLGGWADHPLTDKGRQQIIDKLPQIEALDITFDKVYTSTLIRARQIANKIGDTLSVPVEDLEYALEFNGYGMLSGMLKDEAENKYPEQMVKLRQTNEHLINVANETDEDLKNFEGVLGSESILSFKTRFYKMLETIKNSDHENVIVVTHGGIIGMIGLLIFKNHFKKKEDCGFILLEETSGEYKILNQSGVE